MKVARLKMDGETHYFASLDGECYIGTSREAEAGDEEAVAKMIEGDGTSIPMLMHERGLRYSAMRWGEGARRPGEDPLEVWEV